jgi:membrane protein
MQGKIAARESVTQRLPHLAKVLVRKVQEDDLTGLGAEIAYNAVFAIPAFLLFLVTLAAMVNQFTGVPLNETLLALIDQHAPIEARPLLTEVVQGVIGRVNGLAVSIGALTTIVLALWSGAGGMTAVIKAFNRAYDVKETRPFVRQKLTAIGLTVLSAALVVAAFVLFVFGGSIGAWVANLFGLGSVFTLVWNLLRWPLAIIFIAFMLAVVYYLGPNIQQSFRWISAGSVVATLLWVLAVLGFKFYLLISNPGSAYGAAGSVLVLLFFLYVSGIIVVLGAELNAVLAQQYDPKTVTDLAQHPQKVASPSEQATAHQRAQQFDQREGTNLAHNRPASVEPRQPRGHEDASAHRQSLLGLVKAGLMVAVLRLVRQRLKQHGTARDE